MGRISEQERIFLRLREELQYKSPYYQQLPFEVVRLTRGQAVLRFTIAPHFVNAAGKASGGVLAAFCDSLMGITGRTLGDQVTTLEINMNYICPVPAGSVLVGIGTVIYEGAKTIVVECEFLNEHKEIVVKGRSSFYILQKF